MTPQRGATRAVRAPRARTDLYSALADPTRRQILDLLRDGEQPVNSLVPAFRMTRSAISQHLSVLREAGLVRERRVGRERRYRLDARPLRHVSRWIAPYEKFWDEALDKLGDALDREP